MSIISIVILGTLIFQGPALDSPSPKERLAAIEKMSQSGNTEAIATLESALKKESKSEVRQAILAGLTRIGGPKVPPILSTSLGADLDKDVRLQAIESILRFYIPVTDTGSLQTLFNRAKNLVVQPDRQMLPRGVVVDKVPLDAVANAMSKDSSVDVRASAANSLGSLRAKDYVPAMIMTLEDPQNRDHKPVRMEIIRSLGVIRDPAAGPALAKTLRDGDIGIAKESIVAIGLIGYRDARPQLEEMFKTDTRRDIKEQAIESLAMLRDPAAKPLFESVLTSSNDYLREKGAEGLARTDYDAASFIETIKTEKKASVRNAMAFALASSNHDDYINDLANALTSRESDQAETYIYELGKFKGKVPQLNSYLRSSDPKVRARMAKVLGEIGDPLSRAPIEELTKDTNTDVLREAVNALRQMNFK
jgi:HEAT repeat protein